ncbi:hypothetical protein A9Q75_15515 [Colwellia psychrerythraea]|uniref:Uncharacterized protein n=1 Tax=Colwellia psychrerythraea TaxID=28229 RepID=A0A1Y5E2X2_COLPS|nr:hypothetical protein A9Q75_15515 [Colwellia psychrerythraea]
MVIRENVLLNNHSLQSMPCLKTFQILAESCIFKWNGYIYLKKVDNLNPCNSDEKWSNLIKARRKLNTMKIIIIGLTSQ